MTKVVHDTDIGSGLEISGGKLNAAATMATDVEVAAAIAAQDVLEDAEDAAEDNAIKALGTHLRLSKNAILAPNAAGTAPEHWSMGDIYSATVEEQVLNGQDPATRSALAQEFLNAIKSNTSYFASNFYIWRMKIRVPPNGTHALPLYQRANISSGESTLGCVIKHISGMQPDGAMFNGTEPAPAGAQLILGRNKIWSGGRHHSYSMMHGVFFGAEGEEAEFLIALPAMVTGYVRAEDGWGNLPYLNQSEV
ncbi:MAG: hypothetical protein ACH34X_11315 [Thiolinea sp.]